MESEVREALAAAFAAYRRKDFAAARRQLEDVNHVQALHLLGLVERGDGNPRRAAELLQRAARLLPQDADVANNFGNVLRQLGDDTGAESAYRRALSLRANFEEPATSLGRLLIDQQRWPEAKLHYETLLAHDANSLPARYGYATVLLETGDAENSEAVLNRAAAVREPAPEIFFMRGRARAELGRPDEAVLDFERAYRARPAPYALRALAGQLWLLDRKDDFTQVLENLPGTAADLIVVAADLLRESGSPERALKLIDSADASAAHPDLLAAAAMAEVDRGDGGRAGELARAALALEEDHRGACAQYIVSCLMVGDTAAAMPHIERMREREPDAQHWIAYEATARRMMGDDEGGTLVDVARHVVSYTLPVPNGYPSLEAFNAALAAELERWHRGSAHPLAQSLRAGSQTPRDLAFLDAPVLKAFRQALDGPVSAYLDAIGSDPSHPLTARNGHGYRMHSWWSVRLGAGGYHVNHVHPEGWISSAYYVQIPNEVHDESSRAGWIRFGEPPFPTRPATPPQKWIRPEAGMLVLFPSFLWHGTEAIRDGSTRLTAPFDLVPG